MKLKFLLTLIPFGSILVFSQATDAVKESKGAGIFHEQCIGCHGADGKAQTEMGRKVQAADLTSSQVQGLSESQLAKAISSGKGKMPAFGDRLSAGEIGQVAKFVHGLTPRQ